MSAFPPYFYLKSDPRSHQTSPDFLCSVQLLRTSNMVNDSNTNTDVNGNVKPSIDQNANDIAPAPAANGGEGSCKVVEEEKVNTYTNLDVCFLCGEPATFTCDKCGLVAFCSEKHQKLHRFTALLACPSLD